MLRKTSCPDQIEHHVSCKKQTEDFVKGTIKIGNNYELNNSLNKLKLTTKKIPKAAVSFGVNHSKSLADCWMPKSVTPLHFWSFIVWGGVSER